MTLQEVAQLLRVSPGTVYRLIYRDQIPTFRFGRNYRFSRTALLRTGIVHGSPTDDDAWIAG